MKCHIKKILSHNITNKSKILISYRNLQKRCKFSAITKKENKTNFQLDEVKSTYTPMKTNYYSLKKKIFYHPIDNYRQAMEVLY